MDEEEAEAFVGEAEPLTAVPGQRLNPSSAEQAGTLSCTPGQSPEAHTQTSAAKEGEISDSSQGEVLQNSTTSVKQSGGNGGDYTKRPSWMSQPAPLPWGL